MNGGIIFVKEAGSPKTEVRRRKSEDEYQALFVILNGVKDPKKDKEAETGKALKVKLQLEKK